MGKNGRLLDTSESENTATDTREAEGIEEDLGPSPQVTATGEGVVVEEETPAESITLTLTVGAECERTVKQYIKEERYDPDVDFIFPIDIADIARCMPEWSSSPENQNKIIKHIMLTYHGPTWVDIDGTKKFQLPYLRFAGGAQYTENLELCLDPDNVYLAIVEESVHPLTASVESLVFNTCNLGINDPRMRRYKILFCKLLFGEGRESRYVDVYSANGYKCLQSNKVFRMPVDDCDAEVPVPIPGAVEADVDRPQHLVEKYDRRRGYLTEHKYSDSGPEAFCIY